MTPTQQVLLNAADLVERGWTQGTFARDAEGQQYMPEVADALGLSIIDGKGSSSAPGGSS